MRSARSQPGHLDHEEFQLVLRLTAAIGENYSHKQHCLKVFVVTKVEYLAGASVENILTIAAEVMGMLSFSGRYRFGKLKAFRLFKVSVRYTGNRLDILIILLIDGEIFYFT